MNRCFFLGKGLNPWSSEIFGGFGAVKPADSINRAAIIKPRDAEIDAILRPLEDDKVGVEESNQVKCATGPDFATAIATARTREVKSPSDRTDDLLKLLEEMRDNRRGTEG